MLFDRIAENRIREALERGEFDNLAGAGKPIDLDDYFATPEDCRIGHSILKSANCVPLEVDLLNDVARLERQLSEAAEAGTRSAIRRRLNERRLTLALLMERKRR